MKRSIEHFRNKAFLDGVDNSFEIIDNNELENVKGGDKEYSAPDYSRSVKSFWRQPSVMLDHLK